jgi:hypothetical protein
MVGGESKFENNSLYNCALDISTSVVWPLTSKTVSLGGIFSV